MLSVRGESILMFVRVIWDVSEYHWSTEYSWTQTLDIQYLLHGRIGSRHTKLEFCPVFCDVIGGIIFVAAGYRILGRVVVVTSLLREIRRAWAGVR